MRIEGKKIYVEHRDEWNDPIFNGITPSKAYFILEHGMRVAIRFRNRTILIGGRLNPTQIGCRPYQNQVD